MHYSIKDIATLKQLLWLDCLLGTVNGIAGLCFYNFFSQFFQVPAELMLGISVVTTLYAVFAFSLALKNKPAVNYVRWLVYANWAWVFISCILIYFHIEQANLLGKVFLVLQILVVGGLAYLEGKQIVVSR